MNIKDRDPRPISLDIQNYQIAGFKAKWDKIDPELYSVQRLQHLTKESQETLVDHLTQRALAIGKEQAPNDENKQSNIARDYVLGAVFADEVMNTIPGFDQKIEATDLTRFHNYLDSFSGNPYHPLDQTVLALTPNLGKLMYNILEKKEAESKNYTGTGFIEMCSIRLLKTIGSLTPQLRYLHDRSNRFHRSSLLIEI